MGAPAESSRDAVRFGFLQFMPAVAIVDLVLTEDRSHQEWNHQDRKPVRRAAMLENTSSGRMSP